MSEKESKKNRKKKNIVDEDFLPPNLNLKNLDIDKPSNYSIINKLDKNNSKRKERNDSAVAKGQLNLIIQMLESSDESSMDEKTMRHNVKIAVRNLKEVVKLL